jgi:hypothetical protein
MKIPSNSDWSWPRQGLLGRSASQQPVFLYYLIAGFFGFPASVTDLTDTFQSGIAPKYSFKSVENNPIKKV